MSFQHVWHIMHHRMTLSFANTNASMSLTSIMHLVNYVVNSVVDFIEGIRQLVLLSNTMKVDH